MHSKVFVLAESIQDVPEIYNSLSEEEVVEATGADYATPENEDEFKESLKGLENFCLLKAELETVQTESGTITVASVSTDALLEGLLKEKERRIEKVKEALEREDLFDIAYYAYNQKGYYFYLKKAGFLNEVDMLDYMDDFGLPDRIYIVQTYDYHF